MAYQLDDILDDLAPLSDFDLLGGSIVDSGTLLQLDDSFVQQIIGPFAEEFDPLQPAPLLVEPIQQQQQQQQQPNLLLHHQKVEPQAILHRDPLSQDDKQQQQQQQFNVLESLLRNPVQGPTVTPAPPAILAQQQLQQQQHHPLAAAATNNNNNNNNANNNNNSNNNSSSSVSATDKLIALLLRQREDASRRDDLVSRLVRQVQQESSQQQRHHHQHHQTAAAAGIDAGQLTAAFNELPTEQLEQLVNGSMQIVLKPQQQPQPQPHPQQLVMKLEHLSPPCSNPTTPPQQPVSQQHHHQQQLPSPADFAAIDEDLDEEDDDEMGLMMDSGSGGGGGRGGGSGRKSSHTVIEKKYRQSINSKIDDLRRMLVGRDGKLSKSLVLKRTIDRIHHLERENDSLRRQLSQYRLGGSGYGNARNRDSSLSAPGLSPGAYEDVVSGGGGGGGGSRSGAGSGSESPTSLPSPGGAAAASVQFVGGGGGGGVGGGSTLVQLLQQSGVVVAQKPLLQQQQQTSTAVRCTLMLAACCFLFLLNPLQLGAAWLSGSGPGGGFGTGGGGGGGRSLKGFADDDGGLYRHRQLPAAWWATTLGNCVIVLCLGYRWLLPRTVRQAEEPKRHAARVLAFERCCQLADADAAAGSWRSAWCRTRACLTLLHRPLPDTWAGWAAQLAWHCALAACLRLCSLFRISLPVAEQQRQLAALAALAYGRLLRLTTSGRCVGDSGSSSRLDVWRARALLLNCSNFLGIAGEDTIAADVLPLGERVRLLAGMGLAARRAGLPAWLARRFYRRAGALASRLSRPTGVQQQVFQQQLNQQQQLPRTTTSSRPTAAAAAADFGDVAWLATRQGAAFLADYLPGRPAPLHHRTDDTVYSEPRGPLAVADGPLDRARACFAESLLEGALEGLVMTTGGAAGPRETMRLCQELFSERDPVCCWWAATINQAAVWRSGEDTRSEELPSGTTSQPGGLPAALGEDRLAKSLTLAARVYRDGVLTPHAKDGSSQEAALRAAAVASAGLRELLTPSDRLGDSGGQQLRWMSQAWCLVGCDWLLSARTALGATSKRDLAAFQADLSLARVALQRTGADPRRWLAVHEAALRLLCGANPLSASFCLRQVLADAPDQRCLQAAALMTAASTGSSSAAAGGGGASLRVVRELLARQQAGLDR